MTDIIEQMFGGAIAKVVGREEIDETSIPVREQISRLREMAAQYGKPSRRFRVGDIVTVHPNGDSRGKGKPHIILEVLENPISNFSDGQTGSNQWGQRLDIRVLTWVGENMTTFWLESWKLIPFNPDSSSN